MTLWRRAPRSVYRVYDEESYLSGEGASAGVGGPADDGREQLAPPLRGPRALRLLALGLLGIVTAIAATIVAAQLLHHAQTDPPVAARRDRTGSVWAMASQPPTPASREHPGSTTRSVTAAPVALAPAIPATPAHSSVAASLGGSARRSGGSVVSALVPPTRPSTGVANAAWLSASESLAANESRANGEFGFER